MDKTNKKISIFGGGVMGRGLAQLAAQSGFKVCLFNRSEENSQKSKEHLAKQIQKSVDKNKIEKIEAENVLARITYTQSLEELCSAADLLIENLPEDLALKSEELTKIAAIVSDSCLIASNTSSLSIEALAKASGLNSRLCGMHFFNPPFVMKLLEIVTHEELDEAILADIKAYGEALGRDSIEVKDVAGFATSRLSVTIGLEAIRMIEAKVASVEDIDKAMELGYRHPMGPLKLGDYVGLDVRLKVAEHLYAELKSEVFKPPELLKKMVAEGKTGKKSGQGFYRW